MKAHPKAAPNIITESAVFIGVDFHKLYSVLNRLTRTGGAGSTVVQGHVNEMSTVAVNGQPAQMRSDPVTGGYIFRRTVPVTQGNNTITVTAADTGNPPATTTKSWQINVPGAARSFTYDANGNTLSDGQRTFTWDAKNRLRTVTKNGTTWKWDYDYLDRRVREYTNGTLTKQYVWNGTKIIQERNAANAITRTHFFGGFSDGASPTTGTKYQTLTDHLGNVREVMTATGIVAARYDYTPYQGPVKVGTSTVDPTFLTIGRYQRHTGSGLELALYRAYDPELGRWLSEDPLGEDGGVNLYGYVENLPTARIDRFGLEPYSKAFNPSYPTVAREFAREFADDAVAAGAAGYAAGKAAKAVCPPNKVHSSFPPGYWDAESGSAAWGVRNGVGAKGGRARFHGLKQNCQDGRRAPDKFGVNPDTGDVINSDGEHVGNLEDVPPK